MVRTLREEADLEAGDRSLDGPERPGPEGCPNGGGGIESRRSAPGRSGTLCPDLMSDPPSGVLPRCRMINAQLSSSIP